MQNQKTIIVHHSTEEGIIQLNEVGQVIQSEDNPEWANGLAIASFGERAGFYNGKLGAAKAEAIIAEQAIDFYDLHWVGVDPEGQELELEPQAWFRQQMVEQALGIATMAGAEAAMDAKAEALGVDREGDLEQKALSDGAVMDNIIAKDNTRTAAEVEELDQATSQAFGVVEHVTEVAQKAING